MFFIPARQGLGQLKMPTLRILDFYEHTFIKLGSVVD